MPLSIPIVAVLVAVVYVLWSLFSRYFQRHALDNLPGPPPTSVLFGMSVYAHSYLVANFLRLMTFLP